MMKFKVTSKAVKNNYNNILKLGQASYLLRYQRPVAYNAGVYGWNYDLYIVDGIAIVTGYRPVNSQGAYHDDAIVDGYNYYDFINCYENAAAKIVLDNSIERDTKVIKVNNLLLEMLNNLNKVTQEWRSSKK